MNERQRKFLVESVTQTYNAQKKALEEKIPKEPSINNHVIGALLNNTLVVHDKDVILNKLKHRALNVSKKDEELVEEEESYRRRRGEYISIFFIKIDPWDLMDMPESYKIEKEKYDEIKAKIDKEIEALTQQYKTIVLKVEIGSGKHLENLVMQVDSLGSLDLINTNLLLGSKEPEQKKLN